MASGGEERPVRQELEGGGVALNLLLLQAEVAEEAALAEMSARILEQLSATYPGTRAASFTYYAIGSQPYQVPAPPPGSLRFISPGGPAGNDACHLIMPSGSVALPMSTSNSVCIEADLFSSGGAVLEVPPGSALFIVDCHFPRVCAAKGCIATAGLKKCNGCKAVRYCCREHQAAHWPAHKQECRRLAAGKKAAAAGPEAAEATEGQAAEAEPAEAGAADAPAADE